MIVALLLCLPAFAQDAQQLFHKMQNALGGAEAIAAIRDFEETVRADAWDNGVDQVGRSDSYVLYVDGVRLGQVRLRSIHERSYHVRAITRGGMAKAYWSYETWPRVARREWWPSR